MKHSFWDKHFVAWFRNDLFFYDSQLELANYYSHEFVRRVDKIIPLSAGWVGEHITGVAPPVPVVRHLVMVDRHRKFLTREIGH